MPTVLENYVKQLQLEQLFRKLGASNPETLTRGAEYFTVKEAKKRDRIVIDYFGERGVNRIVDIISELLLEKAKLAADAKTLDVGAGSGFFTVKIADKIRAKLPRASFYAMDMTPAMLLSLEKKNARITSFVGIAENIEGSIKEAREWFNIPSRLGAVFSTLMLHHSIDPEKVFKSLKTVLKKDGKAIVADLCEHHFEEFRTEMGDIHLGFDPKRIYKMAHKHFKEVTVDKTPGIRCECSGQAAEIFVAYMQDHS